MSTPFPDWLVLVVIVGLTALTFLTRSSFLFLGDRITLPDWVRRALRYAPAVALVAIIVPEVLPWQDGSPSWPDERLAAAIVAVLVLLRTRSSVACIAAGMVVFWLLRFLFPG